MYRLLSGFVQHLTAKEEARFSSSEFVAGLSEMADAHGGQFSVLIVGLDNAGKTTFFEAIKIGRIVLSSSVLQFWDLGGQRDIRSIWPKYYSECHALCFVIDSTDKERLEECWKVFETVVTDHRVDGVPTLVLANKQDAEGSMAVEDIKQMFNQLIVEKLNVSEGAVMPISALKGDGIREAVNWLFLRVQNSRTNAVSR